MERRGNYDNNLSPFTPRPPSETVTINSVSDELSPPAPFPPASGRRSSRARRRWAASMHAMYLIRIFESFLHNPFYSLVLSLRMFGLIINIESQSHRMYSSRENPCKVWTLRVLRYMLTTFMVLYILYYSIRITVTVSSGGFWTNLKVLTTSWITFCTVIVFLLRHNHIGSLMVQIQSLNAFGADYIPALKRRVMIAVAGVWIYLAISVITYFLDFSYVKSEDLFVINFGNWYVSKTMASFVVYVDTIFNVYFVRGTLIMIITCYILLCHSIECLFVDLKHFSITQFQLKRDLTIKGLRELKNRHQLLVVFTEELDTIFSFMTFLWFILALISVCIRVNTIIAGEYSSANIEGWISSIWAIGVIVLIFIGIPLYASNVSEEAIQSALHIERLANSHSIKSEINFYYELILFMSRLSLDPTSMTCYKFFRINRFMILMVALIILTYCFLMVHYELILTNIKQ